MTDTVTRNTITGSPRNVALLIVAVLAVSVLTITFAWGDSGYNTYSGDAYERHGNYDTTNQEYAADTDSSSYHYSYRQTSKNRDTSGKQQQANYSLDRSVTAKNGSVATSQQTRYSKHSTTSNTDGHRYKYRNRHGDQHYTHNYDYKYAKDRKKMKNTSKKNKTTPDDQDGADGDENGDGPSDGDGPADGNGDGGTDGPGDGNGGGDGEDGDGDGPGSGDGGNGDGTNGDNGDSDGSDGGNGDGPGEGGNGDGTNGDDGDGGEQEIIDLTPPEGSRINPLQTGPPTTEPPTTEPPTNGDDGETEPPQRRGFLDWLRGLWDRFVTFFQGLGESLGRAGSV